MSPTVSTPRSARSKAADAPMPSATATSEPGTAGAALRRTRIRARPPAPTRAVRPLVAPRSPTRVHTFSKKSPGPPLRPSSFGSWPAMIVSARPTMKPFITGSETKDARKPRRSAPPRSAAPPTVRARAAVIAAKRAPEPSAASPTTAADSAAVAAIGPTTRCAELPRAA
ncbi:hypothetical protein A4G23_05186 [Streptomyces rubrolavendulae]|uniref:Uncharacterized protein n=1 Tax=Streptomyces rubrolavendulae TaxID=285473 RepID=A0A1D8GA24_9ACTN|nr:hypothetical protein A4G23_05186 [Streptomyces rubrolavendulae]